jgi:hypothetical protein
MKQLKHKIRIVAIAGSLGVFGLISQANAAPGDQGQGRGGCVAGEFYGNTSNPRPSGNGVLPSQSPGPFINVPPAPNEPPRNDRTRGLSIGEALQLFHEAGFSTNEAFDVYALTTGC